MSIPFDPNNEVISVSNNDKNKESKLETIKKLNTEEFKKMLRDSTKREELVSYDLLYEVEDKLHLEICNARVEYLERSRAIQSMQETIISDISWLKDVYWKLKTSYMVMFAVVYGLLLGIILTLISIIA